MADQRTESEAEFMRNQPFASWGEDHMYVHVEGPPSPENSKRAVELCERETGDCDWSAEVVWMRYISADEAREAIDSGDPHIPEEACEMGGWIECPEEHGVPFYKLEAQ